MSLLDCGSQCQQHDPDARWLIFYWLKMRNLTISSSLDSTLYVRTQVSTSLSAGTPAFSGPSLEYTGGSDPNNANYVKLSQALNEADIERRKAEEAALARERAHEIRREERQRKIDYMTEMPDSQPAGTGTCHQLLLFYAYFYVAEKLLHLLFIYKKN